ncbi:helix-turn-helix domain-containing protein [Mycolicibacterium sp. 050158]|uniref:helix-turn-helix domain-containing protein n=1 Tax=Mycolicibacterium sp. 050158 TaxID=3090602 RepID=UPI00299D09CF|nr:helix-turn-helix domain-containing protein [Mycolicibacterium sp. 050158]MDX1888987.1 helix-turn-helix domain-containing protein [Mycolicibacterium sp. 050158]
MTKPVDDGGDRTRSHILRAAARQFAVRPYSQVNLEDIVAAAEVTKSVLYTQFRSKMALATAIVEHHREPSCAVGSNRIALGLGGLEALIDYVFLIAAADVGDPLTRAAINLFESIGRFDGMQAKTSENWIRGLTEILERGVVNGDIRPECDTAQVARLMTSLYLGVRQTSNLDDAERFFADFEAVLLLALPGFASPDRLPYFMGSIRRRSALAIRNAAPLGADDL